MNAVVKGPRPLICGPPRGAESGPLAVPSLSGAKLGFLRVKGSNAIGSRFLRPIKAMEDSSVSLRNDCAALSEICARCQPWRIQQTLCGIKAQWGNLIGNIYFSRKAVSYGLLVLVVQLYLHSSNHAAGITLLELYISITRRQGDDTYMKGKSTVACALSQGLHMRGKLTYILDGDNVRHGLNRDLSFKAEDRAENIRRIAEVARLFADAGIICIASLISPYRKDRDVCRALFPEGDFIEVFMDVPLHVCENRDPKGLYKLARAGKIKGFTGVDDPYEPPLNCEIVLQQKGRDCVPPGEMAETVISYLEEKGYLQA